jgi:signal transduction histidine kinase
MSVKDNGPGMSEEFVRQSLFQPFSSTKNSGLGIGLMQSKAIIDAHGGTIAVESRLGRGTRFEVRLPNRPAPESVAAGSEA